MDFGLEGRVALVTGASGGLGFSSAKMLLGEGANVVINSRSADKLGAAKAQLDSLGLRGQVEVFAADVTEADVPGALVDFAVQTFGPVDVLVANSGGPPPARALEITDEQIQSAVNSNMVATVRLVRKCLPQMTERGWGRVAAITSISVKQPLGNLSLSNLSRTALWAWAKTAAADLVGTGVTLNLVCPGFHSTDRLLEVGGAPNGFPMGDPDDFGKIVAFLCSQAAGYISGSAVSVDGGWSSGLL